MSILKYNQPVLILPPTSAENRFNLVKFEIEKQWKFFSIEINVPLQSAH